MRVSKEAIVITTTILFQVALATFTTYALAYINDPNRQLTADRAFVALSLFNLLQFPMTMLPFLISSTVQASVSIKRLSNFLKSDELDPNMVEWDPEPAGGRLAGWVQRSLGIGKRCGCDRWAWFGCG